MNVICRKSCCTVSDATHVTVSSQFMVWNYKYFSILDAHSAIRPKFPRLLGKFPKSEVDFQIPKILKKFPSSGGVV